MSWRGAFFAEGHAGEVGQIGTQFDDLGHVGALLGQEVVYYNGLKQAEVGGTYGLQKLGIHNVGVFFTRGVLIDVLAYKGGDRLPLGYVITPEDIQGTLARQGIREPGVDVMGLRHPTLLPRERVGGGGVQQTLAGCRDAGDRDGSEWR